jgi:hypothetical protein
MGITQLVRLGLLIRFPADLTVNESSTVLGAWHWIHGELLYPNWREYPHRLNPYGPLSIIGPALVCDWVRGGADWATLYTLGRTQSLLTLVGSAAMVGWATVQAGAPRLAGWAAAALALSLWPMVSASCIHARPDAPAAFLALLAVLLAARNHLWLAGITAGLVLGCKANALSAGIVVGIIAAWRVGLPRALSAAVLLASVLSGLLMLWQAVTGELYLDQAATCGDVGWNLANWRQHLAWLADFDQVQIFGLDSALRLLLATAAGLLLLHRSLPGGCAILLTRCFVGRPPSTPDQSEADSSSPTDPFNPLVGFAFLGLVSLGLNAVFLLKVGSASNYFLEAVLAVAGPAILATTGAWGRSVTALVALPLAASLLVGIPVVAHATGEAVMFATLNDSSRPLRNVMTAPNGSLLADLSFIHPDPSTRLMNDPFYVALLINRDKLSPDDILRRIREQQFPEIHVSIVMRASMGHGKSQRILDEIERSYRPVSRSVILVRYLPRR